MARSVTISATQRYALVGKTGSGKTTFGRILASTLVPRSSDAGGEWQVWWIDTKGDPSDIAELSRWGFSTDPRSSRRVFFARSPAEAQDIIARANARHGVVVVIDEYTQVVTNTRTVGDPLLDAFARGRGLGVGVIGHTQEPVYVPRQLLSQASHIFLFDLSYERDVKYAREMYREYERPALRGDPHGFYHLAVDADGMANYYPHAKAWVDSLPRDTRKVKQDD